jgi:cytochrome P450
MKDPQRLAKARKEVDDAYDNGTLSSPVQYNQAINLPYLTSVVKESTRLFPSFQASMPRYAPLQGLEVCGKHIPAGYKIGMNPAIVQHDKGVFGDDASEFNPERWLESEERNSTMQQAILTFGAGTRQCTGRPLAMMEIYKVVPEILRRFEFDLAHSGEWKTFNATFNMQKGVICKFKRRELS